jgi:hypothetical protein
VVRAYSATKETVPEVLGCFYCTVRDILNSVLGYVHS